jgi:hypothetical protein
MATCEPYTGPGGTWRPWRLAERLRLECLRGARGKPKWRAGWLSVDDTALATTPVDHVTHIPRRVRSAVRRLDRRPRLGRGFLRDTGLL